MNQYFLPSGNDLNYLRNPRYYDIEIYLGNNAIGMPIAFNGRILSSDKYSLELIADKNYLNNILTRNIIEYDKNEWDISTITMSGINNLFQFYYFLFYI